MSMRTDDAHINALAIQSETSGANDGESALGEMSLGEGNGYSVAAAHQPLTRNVVASIRTTLAELCNSRAKSTWAPSGDALNSIFQQRQFTDLSGNQQSKGDLKTCVLHSIAATAVKTTFPISLGVDITGVDQQTFAASGSAYSTILLPRAESTQARILQQDDPQVAYDFMNRYPGYTAHNLESNGVHAVPQRRFVLVAGDHPIMTAIRDNQAQLQTSEFSEMPEGLVKMSSSLYDAVMPIVRQQVESQVRVRDYSKANIAIAPAEYASWQSAMETLTAEAVRPIKEDRRRALHALQGGEDSQREKISARFDELEHAATSKVQHTPLEVHMELEHKYNFMG